MKMKYALAIALTIASVSLTAPASAATVHNHKYESIQVMRFTVEPGSNIPQDYFATMMEELVSQLNRTHRFEEVLREGEKPAGNSPVLELTGTITQFNRGNRTVRYMVGFGAGKTKIVAHVKFVDAATGNVQLEKNVDGKVWIGFMGGESIGATKGLAKDVAKLARKNF
jgi:hypothetical protein